MSKIRGKVIGGTATTPINVDAFIKKSLEEGGLINETIKNNSGVKTVTIPEGEEAYLYSLNEGIYIISGKFRKHPQAPIPTKYNNAVAFVSKGEEEEDGDIIQYTYVQVFDTERNRILWEKIGDIEGYFHNGGSKRVLLDRVEDTMSKCKTIDEYFNDICEDESERQDYYPSIGVMADYVERTKQEIRNSKKYYGDAGVIPSNADFSFETDDTTMTATVYSMSGFHSGELVIPYEHVVGDKVYSVTQIGGEAFIGYQDITSIIIPNSVEYISAYAFSDCVGLKSIILPDSVTEIDIGAFLNCSSLTDVYYQGTLEQWENIVLWSDENDCFYNATTHFECVPATKEYVDGVVGTLNDELEAVLDGGVV